MTSNTKSAERREAAKKWCLRMLKKDGVQTLLASLACIILGLLIGFIFLLIINPAGAWDGITTVIKGFFNGLRPPKRMKELGNTLVYAAPMALCALSILFCYKVGLFNIGAAGQYVVGAGMALYAAIGWGLPWPICTLLAMLGGAAVAAVSGVLKAYCNVNEVISGIMLNWISLYSINALMIKIKTPSTSETYTLMQKNPSALLPKLGLGKLFNDNEYVSIGIFLAVFAAVAVWVIMEKTKFGYELKATGFNKHAARYAGMQEKKNIVLSLAIGGALAGLGAATLFLSGISNWETTQTSVPAMGFNGIAAAFLGGLNPFGVLLSAFFLQHITYGGSLVDKTMYCAQISDFIAAIIIYLCGFVLFFKLLLSRLIAKKEDREKKVRSASSETTEDA